MGHTKGYIQVLVVGPESMLGSSVIVKITSIGRWSVFGEVTQILDRTNSSGTQATGDKEICSPCSNADEACACSGNPEPCGCGFDSCNIQGESEESILPVPKNDSEPENGSNRNVIGWLLRKRRNPSEKSSETNIELELKGKAQLAFGNRREWSTVDTALLGGMLISLLTIIALFSYLGSKNLII